MAKFAPDGFSYCYNIQIALFKLNINKISDKFEGCHSFILSNCAILAEYSDIFVNIIIHRKRKFAARCKMLFKNQDCARLNF